MRPSILFRFSQIALILLIVSACAKMSTPSGGKRDKTPPVMIESIPAQGTINFKGKKLVFTFNEYVTLDNINDKLLVSPPMKKKPRVVLKGKSVVTEILEPLRDSTTYSFYYQDAIKDLNEGNKIDNFQFVLSTGPVIDSLSVTGNVYNALDLEVPEKTMVLLYKDLADSAVEKLIPDYISRVDPTGYFRINNVHPGTYRLYALKDADNSLNYNLSDEEFAFMNSPIEVTPEKNYMPFVKDTIAEVKKEKKGAQPSAGNSTKPDNESGKVQEPAFLKGEYQLNPVYCS